jgi:hypothetical protein
MRAGSLKLGGAYDIVRADNMVLSLRCCLGARLKKMLPY